ncbi:MAG: LPS export ABC transporter permease LptG [Parvularculaceae bacterium]|nr:LPS export ABC transporter permease LptG [Parvularculaceae bacterium]
MKALDGVFIRYVGRLFAMRFIGLLAFFVIILQMLDLLNRSEAIMAADGATTQSIFRYIALRAPQIASQFTPFAALLAIVVTLSGLNLSSEIVIMRAAGMSVHRVLAPVGIACLCVAVAHFVFHELVVVKASSRLAYWEANDFAVGLEEDSATRTNIRVTYEGEIVTAASAARTTNGVRLTDVVIYDLDEGGLVRSVTEAASALHDNEGWRLFNVREAAGATASAMERASRAWATALNPELLFALTLNPDRSSIPTIVRQIGQLRRDGADTQPATTSLLSRFSRPMSTLLMPLLGAIAGFGVSRQGNQLVRASVGASLGFVYFVAENLMLAVGKLGVVPPMLGAFFPFAIFLVVGFAILLTMES